MNRNLARIDLEMAGGNSSPRLTSVNPGGDGVSSEEHGQSDSELIQRFTENGEQQALVMLLERYSKVIRSVLYPLLNYSAEDLLDVEQEVAIALYRALPKFKFQSAFSTYLYSICSNTARAYLRRARRREHGQFNEEATPGESVAPENNQAEGYTALYKKSQRDLVQRALGRLSASDRLIIHLREFEELSVKETARILGCPAGTAKSRLNRAKKKIYRIINGGHQYA